MTTFARAASRCPRRLSRRNRSRFRTRRAGCEQFTGLTSDAQQRGYIIAYADNVTPTDFGPVEQAAGTIPAVSAKWCVDPRRVYVTGHSNGGTITEIIGAKRYAPVAAIAPSAAGLSADHFASKVGYPKAPLPEMEMHSSGDQLFPISMGFGADVAKVWAMSDGCNPSPGGAGADGCIRYTSCSNGTEVRYCEGVDAHGVWPGRNKSIFDFFDRFTGQ